jgi:hypothetical protein
MATSLNHEFLNSTLLPLRVGRDGDARRFITERDGLSINLGWERIRTVIFFHDDHSLRATG